MIAVVCPRYGPPEVLRLRDLPDPTPRASELLVRVHATTVTSADARIRALRMPSPIFRVIGRLALGFTGPRQGVLGVELAGVVERTGPGVSRFGVGDAVVAALGVRMGAHAELVRVRESAAVAGKPQSLSFQQAVAIPFGAMTALYFLRDLGKIGPGQRVLVVGASGAVGVAAVQLARHLGARADGVCSAANAALVRSLGADSVFDYATTDYARLGAGEYDAVFDTVGATTLGAIRGVLKPGGRFLPAVLTGRELGQIVRTRLTGGRRVIGGVTPERRADLELVLHLAATGALRPIIDSEYTLSDIAAAHRRVDTGRKVGAVIVRMPAASPPPPPPTLPAPAIPPGR